MEHSYLASVSLLREILDPLASLESCYRLVPGCDTVSVIRYGPAGVFHQTVFPVVHRIPGVPEDEGTLILMVATERSREFEGFWEPVEKHLGRISVYPSA